MVAISVPLGDQNKRGAGMRRALSSLGAPDPNNGSNGL
jgi:hypothetical protein